MILFVTYQALKAEAYSAFCKGCQLIQAEKRRNCDNTAEHDGGKSTGQSAEAGLSPH